MPALAASTSQVPALSALVSGDAAPRMSQAVMLAGYAPPQSKIARTVETVMLAARSAGVANVAARTSQLVELVAYKTGVPDPRRTRAWTFVLDGHTFYVLDLGNQGTFLYDKVTNQWCNFSTQGFEPQWNFINGTMWGTRVVGADMLTDQVWEQVPTAVVDEDWRPIAHVVTGGLSVRNRVFIGCDAVRVSCSMQFLDEVNGASMNLRYSDDQEVTWSDYYTVDLIADEFDGEVAYRSLGSFMAPGRIFELSDSGGLIRIDGADAFLNGFDDEDGGGGGQS